MSDVIIIGGGLSGLVAALELERNKVSYTVIEVKDRLGGSIQTITQDGFVMDMGIFALAPTPALSEVGLADATYPLYLDKQDIFAFRIGAEHLIRTLSERLTGTKLMRMAVSSIGEIENRFTVCLENGLMFSAKALIVAVPARYAERMFYGYIPEISQCLLNYHYDSLLRVSMGFRTHELTIPKRLPADVSFSYLHHTNHLQRVPDGHTMVHMAVRVKPETSDAIKLVQNFQQSLGFPQPVTQLVAHWHEADPLSCYDADHRENLQFIQDHLPAGIALIGNDYCFENPMTSGIFQLEERFIQGRQAAHKVMQWLEG